MQRDLMRRARREAMEHLQREEKAGISYDMPQAAPIPPRTAPSLLRSDASAAAAPVEQASRPAVQRANSFAGSASRVPLCDARSRRALERFRTRSFERRRREPSASAATSPESAAACEASEPPPALHLVPRAAFELQDEQALPEPPEAGWQRRPSRLLIDETLRACSGNVTDRPASIEETLRESEYEA